MITAYFMITNLHKKTKVPNHTTYGTTQNVRGGMNIKDKTTINANINAFRVGCGIQVQVKGFSKFITLNKGK